MEIEEQIKRMKQTKRVYMSTISAILYFRISFLILAIPLFNLYSVIEAKVNGWVLPKRIIDLQPISLVLVLIALFIGYLLYDMLVFKTLKVKVSEQNFKLKCAELCMENNWILDYLRNDCLIAYERETNEGQKIVVLRLNDEILVNSLFDINNMNSGFWPTMNKKHLGLVEEKMGNIA